MTFARGRTVVAVSNFEEETVMNDDSFGGGSVCIDTSGNFSHLPPRERKKAKERQLAQHEKWRRANDRRSTWSQAQFEEEEKRLREEIENWGQRDAA